MLPWQAVHRSYFPAIAVCDGIAMGHIGMKYSLVTRDLIADSTEAMAIAHQFDALVMVPNCDKNVPGLLMAAARVNVPTVFVSGGPMLAGHVKGQKTSLSSMFEAVGSYAAGKMTEEDVLDYEQQCLSDLRFLFRYVYSQQYELSDRGYLVWDFRATARFRLFILNVSNWQNMPVCKLWNCLEKNIRPRDIMTEKAFMNALTVDMALGCSTNTMLHLPAIAHEAGVEI